MRYASRVSAFRRELNSHDAAQPQYIHFRSASDWENPHAVAARRALKSHLAAQAQADHELELEEAAVLRFASNFGLPLLCWLPSAVRSAQRYQAGPGTVGDRQRRTGKEVGCRCGSKRGRRVSSQHSSSCREGASVKPVCTGRALMPNPSLNLTRYGRQRKPGVRRLRHLRTPGLHCLPPRAG